MDSDIETQFSILEKEELKKLSHSLLYYLHGLIYSELIEILNVILDGVNPIWNNKGYNATLVLDNYKNLYGLWKKIDRHPELQKLKIGEFKEFIYIDNDFPATIKMWEMAKSGYWEDLQLLKHNVKGPFPIPADLESLFKTTRQTLNIYQQQKEYLQELPNLNNVYIFDYLVLNYQQGYFLYQGKAHEFQPGINEFQFLKILLDNRGNIVKYDEIYKAMHKKQISTIDPKEEIRQIRKNLRKQFVSLGIDLTETDFMLSRIIAKTNLGYILF